VERRNSILLISIVLVWTGFFLLQVFFAPKKPPQPKAPAGEVAKNEADKAAKEKANNENAAQPGEPAKPGEAPPAAEIAAPTAPAVPRQWLTLGSLDATSGYSALYSFDNRGAAVERVELNGKYKSVEDYTGYLGHLELTRGKTGGAVVNVVGAGTPAALAKGPGNVPPGLAVGDTLQTIDGVTIESPAALDDYFRTKTRPGHTAMLTLLRQGHEGPLTFTALLVRRPLEIVSPEPHGYKLPNGRIVETAPDPLSLLVTLDGLGGAPLKDADREMPGLPSLYDSNWKVEQTGPDFVEFSFTLDEAAMTKIGKQGSLKIVKRYSVPKAEKPGEVPYHLNMQVSVQNLGEEPQKVSYRLEGPTGLPLEGWWYSTKLNPLMFKGAGARDVVYEQAGLGHQLLGGPAIVSEAKKGEKEAKQSGISILQGDQAAPFAYAGVDTQFFAAVVQPQVAEGQEPIRFRSAVAMSVQQDLSLLPKTRLRTADVSFRLTTSAAEIKPGTTLTHDYRVFFGPKDPHVLSQYNLKQLIELGWPIFGVPAQALRYVLNGLYWLTSMVGIPNYGIAIILLTVIVRMGMIPVSLKQARSAAKMQELAPEIQKIKDKFPDDPMKQHQAVQELYKKHDFNMFGGCLPVFIQLPIFIGLYRCLSVDIDLRDASLIPGVHWASNLAGPDRLFYWKDWMPAFIADEADGWLGPFFNVLPLITVALFLVQQKMFTPPATDEQTRMQQKMMTYMTVFMGVMFYKVPAGLCLYFITSSLWGICERKLLPKPQPKTAGATSGGDSGNGGNGGGGLFSSLMPQKPAGSNGSSKPVPARRKQKR